MWNPTVTLRAGRTSVLALIHAYIAHCRAVTAQTVTVDDVPPMIRDLDVHGIVVQHLMQRIVHTGLPFFNVVNSDILVRQMALHTGNVRMGRHGMCRRFVLHGVTGSAEFR